MKAKTVISLSTLRSLVRPANVAVLARACRRAVLRDRRTAPSLDASLDAVYRWLCAAHDANGDGGVAATYNLVRGWSTSYPETTGYIIPTFLHYAEIRELPAARARALRMADWEIDVQLPDGAVRSGAMGIKIAPAVFNTGQVLFGWAAACSATGDQRYANAAARASEWLLRVQDADGAWRRRLSALTTSSVEAVAGRGAEELRLGVDAADVERLVQRQRLCR